MGRIALTNPEGLTHVKLVGFYITNEITAEENFKQVFIRYHVGTVNGSDEFVRVYTDQIALRDAEYNQLIGANINSVQATTFGAFLEEALSKYLIATGKIDGTYQ